MEKCQRCGGQMFYRKHYTPSGSYWSWDCLQCGESIDPEILANRKQHEVPNPKKHGRKSNWGMAYEANEI